MKQILFVGAGGFVGSILRFKIGELAAQLFGAKFPLGTLTVNLAGCFLIGYLGGLIEKRDLLGPELRLLLITGFLGGFTTFSAFEFETFSLLRRDKLSLALFYIGASVLGGLLLVWLGWKATGATSPKL